jgi:hypothetical protein
MQNDDIKTIINKLKLNHKQHIMMDAIDLDMDSTSDCESICAEFTFAHQFNGQNDGYHSCILLDSGSSCSVFCDKTLLTDIQRSDHSITAYTNGSAQESHYSGDFSGFSEFGITQTAC